MPVRSLTVQKSGVYCLRDAWGRSPGLSKAAKTAKLAAFTPLAASLGTLKGQNMNPEATPAPLTPHPRTISHARAKSNFLSVDVARNFNYGPPQDKCMIALVLFAFIGFLCLLAALINGSSTAHFFGFVLSGVLSKAIFIIGGVLCFGMSVAFAALLLIHSRVSLCVEFGPERLVAPSVVHHN